MVFKSFLEDLRERPSMRENIHMDLWGTGREKWKWVELGLHHVQLMVNGCGERLCSAQSTVMSESVNV
jgi:hypothetical protein